MDFDPALNPIMEQLTQALREEIPGFAEILDEASGDDVMSTMLRLNTFLKEHPEYTEVIETLTRAAFTEAPEPQLPAVSVDTSKYPIAIDDAHVVVQPPGSRIPQLNPLLQAAIAERVQFDGDAPELRFGPLPEGVLPAVPVDTQARNPVAIGMMLDTAADEVGSEIAQLEYEHEQKLLAYKDSINVDRSQEEPQLPVGWEGETSLMAPDPEGYKRGQMPTLRKVNTPEIFDLAGLTPEERSQVAYKVISTTQGRRSVAKVLREMIFTGLQGEGYEIEVNDNPMPIENVPVYAEWTTSIQGGSYQGSFSFVDTAAKVLGTRLAEQLDQIPVEDPILEVMPINTVDVRQVGWSARVVSRYF